MIKLLARFQISWNESSFRPFTPGTLFPYEQILINWYPRLMREMKRREVCCDIGVMARMCEWIMNVEEEGMEQGYVPEESRMRMVVVLLDDESKVLHVSGLFPGEEEGKMQKREMLFKS